MINPRNMSREPISVIFKRDGKIEQRTFDDVEDIQVYCNTVKLINSDQIMLVVWARMCIYSSLGKPMPATWMDIFEFFSRENKKPPLNTGSKTTIHPHEFQDQVDLSMYMTTPVDNI